MKHTSGNRAYRAMKQFGIIETRHWFGPSRTSDIAGDINEPYTFASRNEALAWIAEPCKHQCLAHNESSIPSYQIWRTDSARYQSMLSPRIY